MLLRQVPPDRQPAEDPYDEGEKRWAAEVWILPIARKGAVALIVLGGEAHPAAPLHCVRIGIIFFIVVPSERRHSSCPTLTARGGANQRDGNAQQISFKKGLAGAT